MKTNLKTISALHVFVSAAGIILIVIGLAVLAGWVFDIQFLKSVLPRAANMQFNTAVGILCGGVALWFLRDEEDKSSWKLIAQVFAILVLLIGSLSLSEYLFRWNLGIDELFIKDPATSPSAFPGRMSPISTICFTLCGLSLLLIGTKLSQYLALSALTLSLLAVIGYLFDYEALYQLPGYVSIALHTGLSFLILSLGILGARPSLGFMKFLSANVAAGQTARFLLPTTILLIILLGYAVELGEQLGILASEYESVVLVVLLILVYTPLIYFYLSRIHRAEMEIVRLNRLYATLSQVNQTIVRVKSQQELFEAICKVSVEFGQFRLAWIGLFNGETGQVTPVAEHGHGENRLPFPKIDANASPFDGGLTALAIRSGSPQFSHDIQADPHMAHWHESSALGGYHFAAALPIRQKGQVIGLLSLYAADIGFFAAKEERNLLEELALDISFALDAIQVEAERERAEGRFRLVVESVPNSIVMVDSGGRIVLVNVQTERLFGYSRAELIGRSVDILVPDRYRTEHANHRALFLDHPSARPMGTGRDLFGLRKDGSEFPVEIGLSPIETEQGSVVLASIVDITERKQAEERFRLAVESAPNAIILLNREGIIETVNSQTEKFFGYDTAQLVGLDVERLVPVRFRGIHPEHRKSFLADPQIRPMGVGRDLHGVRQDGSEFPVEIGLTPIETSTGLLVMATVVDITERKQAEEQFYLAVESAPNAIILVNKNGAIHLVNSQAEKFFGYHRAELIGLNIDRLVPEHFRGKHAEYRETFLADPQVRSMGVGRDLHALRKDGSEFPVEIGLTPIETRDGLLIMATIVDITERKRAGERNRFLANLVASVSDAIIAVDMQQNIQSWNKGAESLYGWQEQEVLGRPSKDILDTNFLGTTREAVTKQIMAQGSWSGEALQLHRDGTRTPVQSSVALYKDSEGRPAGIVAVNRDITERKRAEEALQQKNEELKAMSQQLWQAAKLATMGELAASIAHELNNPLATLSLRAEMLQARFSPDDPQSRSLQVIDSEIKRMSSLVANLLQFSRRSASQFSTINVNEELADTLELIQYHLRKYSIRIVQELSPELPPIQADRQQLRQVFLNLFTNAADAMPLGGLLTIRTWSGEKPEVGTTRPLRRTANQSLGLPVSGVPQIFIEVSDTGEGIPADKLERVWEPFYTTKPEGKGTGLGLAICRRIIQEHGGTIELNSGGVPGKGATIRLALSAMKER